MALPELYRYGREGHWFSMKWFVLYMLDGIFQVCLVYSALCGVITQLVTVCYHLLSHQLHLLFYSYLSA